MHLTLKQKYSFECVAVGVSGRVFGLSVSDVSDTIKIMLGASSGVPNCVTACVFSEK